MKRKFSGVCVIACAFLLACVCLLSGCANIILPERQIKTNKFKYYSNEEILITARGEDGFRVGIYKLTENVYDNEAIRQYFIGDKFVSGETYGLQSCIEPNPNRMDVANLPAGAYSAVLFDRENKIREITPFFVSGEQLRVPDAPTGLSYTPSDKTSGLAAGEVKVYFDSNYHAEEVALYWAGENGIMPDMEAIATVKVTSNPTTIVIKDDVVIPQNATKLVAVSVNKLGVSETYAECDL